MQPDDDDAVTVLPDETERLSSLEAGTGKLVTDITGLNTDVSCTQDSRPATETMPRLEAFSELLVSIPSTCSVVDNVLLSDSPLPPHDVELVHGEAQDVMHTESDTVAVLTAPAHLLSTSPQFVYVVCTGSGFPPLELKTYGDNMRFGEVLTLTGDRFPRAGRITTRRCGVPGCAVDDNERTACVTGRELVTDDWSTCCFVGLEQTCPQSDRRKIIKCTLQITPKKNATVEPKSRL